jgi:hypothetical protein
MLKMDAENGDTMGAFLAACDCQNCWAESDSDADQSDPHTITEGPSYEGAPPYFCALCQREFRRSELGCVADRDSLDNEPVMIETLTCPNCGALLAVDLEFAAA